MCICIVFIKTDLCLHEYGFVYLAVIKIYRDFKFGDFWKGVGFFLFFVFKVKDSFFKMCFAYTVF